MLVREMICCLFVAGWWVIWLGWLVGWVVGLVGWLVGWLVGCLKMKRHERK